VDELSALRALDEALLHAGRGSPAWAAPLFVVVTMVGGGWGLFGLLPLLRRPSARPWVLWLLCALSANSAAVGLIKALVGRVRPCDALAWCAPLMISSPGGPSFPSGHAAGAFAFATFVARLRPAFAAPALLFAVAVAWSRCFLGVHYPSDIACGAVLGSLFGLTFASLALRNPGRIEGFLMQKLRGSARSGSRSPASSPPAPGSSGTPDRATGSRRR
jgi:undecaprenyl-diphosphatase